MHWGDGPSSTFSRSNGLAQYPSVPGVCVWGGGGGKGQAARAICGAGWRNRDRMSASAGRALEETCGAKKWRAEYARKSMRAHANEASQVRAKPLCPIALQLRSPMGRRRSRAGEARRWDGATLFDGAGAYRPAPASNPRGGAQPPGGGAHLSTTSPFRRPCPVCLGGLL